MTSTICAGSTPMVSWTARRSVVVSFIGSQRLMLLADQLHEVLVAGDHHHRMTACGQPPGEGADQIVGLVAGHFEDRQPIGRRDRLDVGDLNRHLLGHRRPVGLVVRKQVVPEGGAAGVEEHGGIGRAALLHELDQHAGEAEDRVGRKPPGIGQALDGMIGAVDVGGAVDEIDGVFRFMSKGLAKASRPRDRPGIRHRWLTRSRPWFSFYTQ